MLMFGLPRSKHNLVACATVCLMMMPGTITLAQARGPIPSRQRPAKQAPQKEAEPFADLTPLDSGPGVIVFDPVCPAGDVPLAEFAAGCAAWLHLVVASQPEFGKTPTWGAPSRVVEDRRLPSMRLGLAQAREVAKPLGVTHVVVGSASRSGDKLTMRFQAHLVSSGQPVGAPEEMTGTETEIIERLQPACRNLCKTLGASPAAFSGVGLDAEGMRLTGRAGRCPGNVLSSKDARTLGLLASRSLLPAMIYIHQTTLANSFLRGGARNSIVHRLGTNLMAMCVMHEMEQNGAASVRPSVEKAVQEHPNNLLANTAMAFVKEETGDTQAMIDFARTAVRCSRANAESWVTLGSAYSAAAATIRKARVVSAMSKEELDACFKLYPYWVLGMAKAVDVDPKYTSAWIELASAACFVGEEELANAAFDQVMELNANSIPGILWGLEMYQPKWLADEGRMDKVVARALAVAYPDPSQGIDAARKMLCVGARVKAKADGLIERMIAQARAQLARRPDDFRAAYAIGAGLDQQEKYRPALDAFLVASALSTTYRPMNLRLGTLRAFFKVPYGEPSIASPQTPFASKRAELGHDLFVKKSYADAETELARAARESPDDAQAHYWLGRAYEEANKPAAAMQAFARAAALAPSDRPVRLAYLSSLAANDRNAERILFALKALDQDPSAVNTRAALSSALQKAGRLEEAASHLRRVVEATDNQGARAGRRTDLAKILWESGRRDEAARELWIAIEEYPFGAKTALDLRAEYAKQMAKQ